MTDDIFENIVAQTCLYADQYITSHTIGPVKSKTVAL